jgi:hypothetical protein
MKLQTPPRVAEIEYCVAPWHMRLWFWLQERYWCWCQSFQQPGVESPEQVNPLWRR